MSAASASRSPGFPEETTARLLPEETRGRSTSSASLGGPPSSCANNGPQLAVRTPERYTLAIMGRSGVGKSAITLRYTRGRFADEYDPTIEDLHLKNTTIAGAAACLEILDTAGQETYSALRRSWMQHGSGFLFVFSLVDRQTFDELGAFYDELMDLYNNDPPPSVLVANKADVDTAEWVVGEEEVRRMKANWRNCTQVFYTSAKSSRNVADVFDSLCLAVRDRALKRRRAARDREAAAVRELSATPEASCRRCQRCRFAQCTTACALL